MFRCSPWLRFHIFSTDHSQNFSLILAVSAGDVFECFQRITAHERVEVVYFGFFCKLIVDFQTCWEQIFNQFVFLWFPVKGGDCRCEGFGQFRVSADVVVELAELLFVANCWRANSMWSASIVTGVFSLQNCGWLLERAFFCFFWRSSRGAVGNLFLHSCHHVISLFLLWIIWITRVRGREHRFGTGIA